MNYSGLMPGAGSEISENRQVVLDLLVRTQVVTITFLVMALVVDPLPSSVRAST